MWCQAKLTGPRTGGSGGSLGRCARHEQARDDVCGRNGIHRHHPTRLPDEHGIRGVEDGVAVERGPDPTPDRLVAQPVSETEEVLSESGCHGLMVRPVAVGVNGPRSRVGAVRRDA